MAGPLRHRDGLGGGGGGGGGRAPGEWLASLGVEGAGAGGGGGGRFDFGALAEASELGLDSRVSGSVLSALRRDRPPSFAEAQAQAAAMEARWEAAAALPAPGPRGGPPRSRSNSRGPSLGDSPPHHRERTSAVAAAAGAAILRPPRPGGLVSSSSTGSASAAAAAAAHSPSPAGTRAPSPSTGSRAPLPAASAAPVTTSFGPPRMRGGGVSDDSLLSGMAARLAQVEQLNQQLSAKLAAQTQEMEALRSQVAELTAEAAAGMGEYEEGEGGACSSSSPARSPQQSPSGAGCGQGAGGPGAGHRRPRPGAEPMPPDVAGLRAECSRLRGQVEEMSGVLAEYGLSLAPRKRASALGGGGGGGGGGPGDGQAAVHDAPAPGGRGGGAGGGGAAGGGGNLYMAEPGKGRGGGGGDDDAGEITVNIKVLKARIDALNSLLDEEGTKVVQTQVGGANRASLCSDAPAPLPLSFFGDGIKLADRAFLPYTAAPAQKLLKEILGGFFPGALQEEYPSGVPLKVVDRTRRLFRDWLRECAASDPELADGGDRLQLLGAGGHAVNAPSNAQGPGERLLAKLPERVIRGGKVCEIRGAIAEQLGGGGGSSAGARHRCSSAPANGPPNPGAGAAEAARPGGAGAGAGAGAGGGEVMLLDAGRDPAAPSARLQVKLETGHRVTLMMEAHATVGQLWQALDRWRSQNRLARAGADGRRCTLRTAFPPKAYVDLVQTLADAGFTPSATLFISAEAGST